MPRLKALLMRPAFLPSLLAWSAVMLALQTFFLGRWALPLIGYRVGYMGGIGPRDAAFIVAFSVAFGLAAALFVVGGRRGACACSLGSAGGGSALLTMLCPVCPVFFLALIGVPAAVTVIAPFFWPLRALATALVLVSVFLLWKRLPAELRPSEQFDAHVPAQGILLTAILVLLIGNQAAAQKIAGRLLHSQADGTVEISGDFAQDVAALVTPTSLPFYGPELGLDFSSLEKINASINVLASMEPDRGRNAITLAPEEKARYIAIGTQPTVTCEFCCGVKTLVRPDGSATCGCAHARAMMGTAAYLLRNRPELGNDDISYELVRQKGLYFPGKMQQRMAEQLAGDKEKFSPDIRLLTMKLNAAEFAGLQTQAKASGFTPPPQSPGMVGGC